MTLIFAGVVCGYAGLQTVFQMEQLEYMHGPWVVGAVLFIGAGLFVGLAGSKDK